MPSLTKTFEKYRVLFEKGDNLILIDLFYDDEIQQVENDDEPMIGKIAIKERERKTLESVHSFEQKIVSLIIDEEKGMVMGEMLIFFDSKKFGPKKLLEAFIQQWKNGKIAYQKFYYKSFINNNGK